MLLRVEVEVYWKMKMVRWNQEHMDMEMVGVFPLKTKHRVITITDYTVLECSTSHLNDCIRFEDDSDRT